MNKTEHRIIIQTENLTRRFGTLVAVQDLNLLVPEGELFGLVGPDGAGKTTTIRLLSAILDPTHGWARVGGYNTVRQPEEIKKMIGYMSQRFTLYGDLTVKENLNFFADIFGVPQDVRRERIEKLLDFARLSQFTSRRAEHLSGGMKKKLALACTLVHEPRILFLDEPTTGVDPVSRREFWEILSRLHYQGATIFVSTPYMDEAERCSRVGLLVTGRMIICDTPSHIQSLIKKDIFEIKPSDPQSARAMIKRLSFVEEAEAFGDVIHLIPRGDVTDPAALQQKLRDEGVEVPSIRKIEPRLEDAFVMLIKRQGTAGPILVEESK